VPEAPDDDGRLLNCVVRVADDGRLTPVASLGLWVTVPLRRPVPEAPDDDEDGRLLNCVVREADDGMLTPVASLGLWVTVPL
jgi:hypothetical protein